MITKMEANTIKSLLNENLNSNLTSIAADHTTMKIGKSVNKMLEHFLMQYKIKSGNDKIGKSAYLWILLKQFRDEQRALLRYDEVDHKIFDKSMLDALQAFKRIMKNYVDRSISSQSEAVLAILMYNSVRQYEIANDFKTTDYLDDEYEDDMLERKGVPIRVHPKKEAPASVPLATIDQDLSDLFEDEPPKLQVVSTSLRREK